MKIKNLFISAISVSSFFIASCSKSTPEQGLPEKRWWVSTVAGNGKNGHKDGVDSLAEFGTPSSITFDNNGSLYVTDHGTNFVRKISNGNVTTVTNSGYLSSLFNPIWEVAFDKNNQLYTVEAVWMRRIYSYDSNKLFVGGGGAFLDFKDGTGTAAQFTSINHVATDDAGNFYLTDYDMSDRFRIRKVTPDAVVSTLELHDETTIATNSGSYRYSCPIAVDYLGNIFFTAADNSIIKKADKFGTVEHFAGSVIPGFKAGKGKDAKFTRITGLACDAAGNVYVTDDGTHAVCKITPDANVSIVAGKATAGFVDGDEFQALFFMPSGIVADKNGILYVADAGNNRIRKIEYR